MEFIRRNVREVVLACLTMAGLVWAFWGETPGGVRARLDPDSVYERWALLEFQTPDGRPVLHEGRNMRPWVASPDGAVFLVPPRHQVTFAGLRPGGRVDIDRATMLAWARDATVAADVDPRRLVAGESLSFEAEGERFLLVGIPFLARK